ncbi:hypothetical protein HELRODRAFT_74975 [Helobdella robusta]|uniref:Glutaredoxin domain-containing protein n=1 Tax=Helobdella robusta TaxID=6412 RepID=T1G1Z0_HELRO|nr:hypothetical protein HELRODRAFT_74975 [Helobdella robusta]ESO08622.1 hypothetical protein HELRODRAFT_74975 [Helobdella robusta]
MEFVKSKINQYPVFVFSKSHCPYCTAAKNVLNSTGVQYGVEEIENRSDCSQIQDALQQITGARTVPRVFIGGKCIGGGSDTQSLHQNNRLVPLLKEAGARFNC